MNLLEQLQQARSKQFVALILDNEVTVGEFVTELNSHANAFLFGRRTFDIFRGYWPDQTDPDNPIATAINSLPKYVVSNSLHEHDATWRGEHPDTARLVAGDVVAAVQALKDEPGDELQIWGSSTLLQNASVSGR